MISIAHLFRSLPPSFSDWNELYRNNPFRCALPPPPPPSVTEFASSFCRCRPSHNVFSRFAMFCSTSNSICRSFVDSVGDSGRELNSDDVRFWRPLPPPPSSFSTYSMSKSIVIYNERCRDFQWAFDSFFFFFFFRECLKNHETYLRGCIARSDNLKYA